MTVPFIRFAEGEAQLDWLELTDALVQGHKLPKAEIGDTFLYRDPDTMLSRSAWIDGMGLAVKTCTIFPGNPDNGHPMINGIVSLYSDQNGTLDGMLDFHLVTKWKTAGDSLLGALLLAREDSREILIIGAGTVGASLCEAFGAGYPDARITVWNRTASKAQELAAAYEGVAVADDLEAAVKAADIIITATMSSTSVIRGEWLRPGQHVNLIGAYRPDMREADDETMRRGKVYVDSFDTTLDHIGELRAPLEAGVLERSDVLADYYSIDSFQRGTADDITVFKNGGGAHMDLMVSRYIFDRWNAAK